ncbi:hypothetical protein [Xenorhabdus bovienii]|uniref:hypothetical protein n=1 Tax=Xenorhabdus bovienii TaxID=40576 RepID=UPI0023B2B3CE|nr:hypothetical protein [Xenorhabdus bovienii]
MTKTICIGIDVAKASLEIALGAQGTVMTYPNTPEGHDELAATLTNYEIDLVVLEATGGYEVSVACVLQTIGLCSSTLNLPCLNTSKPIIVPNSIYYLQ